MIEGTVPTGDNDDHNHHHHHHHHVATSKHVRSALWEANEINVNVTLVGIMEIMRQLCICQLH